MMNVCFRAALQLFTVTGIAVLGSSCSTVTEKHATYLQDRSQLQPQAGNQKIRTYRSAVPAAAFGRYEVGPMVFLAPEQKLDAEQKQVLVDRLTNDLQRHFSTMPQSNARGAKVVQVRGAITAADKANVWVNLLADAVLNFPVSMGGVAVELEARSQPGNQRVAAGQYFMPGRPWQLIASHSETGQARSGVDKAAAEFFTLVTGQKPRASIKPPAQRKPEPTARL